MCADWQAGSRWHERPGGLGCGGGPAGLDGRLFVVHVSRVRLDGSWPTGDTTQGHEKQVGARVVDASRSGRGQARGICRGGGGAGGGGRAGRVCAVWWVGSGAGRGGAGGGCARVLVSGTASAP